jgi:1,4-dihydroxy-2-naphthoyl-CoA hydrolase
MALRTDIPLSALQSRVRTGLPAHLGMEVQSLGEGELVLELPIRPPLLAPNGYLHAGTIVSLADTACGFACIAHLPEGANNFTTIELKTNFLGTALEGRLRAVARAVHLGRTTQVWDATVTELGSGRTLAYFRCTQLVLRPAP